MEALLKEVCNLLLEELKVIKNLKKFFCVPLLFLYQWKNKKLVIYKNKILDF
jgi:hypothetical protein